MTRRQSKGCLQYGMNVIDQLAEPYDFSSIMHYGRRQRDETRRSPHRRRFRSVRVLSQRQAHDRCAQVGRPENGPARRVLRNRPPQDQPTLCVQQQQQQRWRRRRRQRRVATGKRDGRRNERRASINRQQQHVDGDRLAGGSTASAAVDVAGKHGGGGGGESLHCDCGRQSRRPAAIRRRLLVPKAAAGDSQHRRPMGDSRRRRRRRRWRRRRLRLAVKICFRTNNRELRSFVCCRLAAASFSLRAKSRFWIGLHL